MKKFLRYSHLLTLLCGILGMLLMVWLRAGGPDEKGLYPARHPAWTLLGILTAVIGSPFFIFLITRRGENV